MKSGLTVFAGILRELRSALPKGTATQDASYKYVVSQFQKYQLTPEQICRDPKAAYHQASTYFCYLESSRRNKELIATYKGKGERSIGETASMVGLRLPKNPTDET